MKYNKTVLWRRTCLSNRTIIGFKKKKGSLKINFLSPHICFLCMLELHLFYCINKVIISKKFTVTYYYLMSRNASWGNIREDYISVISIQEPKTFLMRKSWWVCGHECSQMSPWVDSFYKIREIGLLSFLSSQLLGLLSDRLMAQVISGLSMAFWDCFLWKELAFI